MNEFKQTGAEGESNKEESESKASDGNAFHKASEGTHTWIFFICLLEQSIDNLVHMFVAAAVH